MATWLLPEHFADMLPEEARRLETMREKCLALFKTYGFELVNPPMIEFVESLLKGSGSDLDTNTFKFTDQANGKTVGIRADFTPQAARIDAHILNREGATRLCYVGNCLHARPMHPLASREPIVAGAELFGATGFAADSQMITLAVKALRSLGVSHIHLDLGHTGVLTAILKEETLSVEEVKALVRALRMKNPVALKDVSSRFQEKTQKALFALISFFGKLSVLTDLKRALASYPEALSALNEIESLAAVSGADDIGIDLCDVHGYRYLTGVTFSVYVPSHAQAVLRGGRYDGIGTAFGRDRPACGFSIYLREILALREDAEEKPKAYVVKGDDKVLLEAAEKLREQGHIVIALLPNEKIEDVAKVFTLTHEVKVTDKGFELQAL